VSFELGLKNVIMSLMTKFFQNTTILSRLVEWKSLCGWTHIGEWTYRRTNQFKCPLHLYGLLENK